MTDLQSLQKKIHALKLQRNRELKKQSSQKNTFRKARTRTLIQLGGLVQKAGIAAHFDVALGEDLQGTLEGLDKAELILGFLLEALQKASEDPRDQGRTLGKAFLR